MELFELGDLGLYLNVQGVLGLPEAQAIDISQQLLNGLEILHKYHFTHRDLKPQASKAFIHFLHGTNPSQNIFVASVSPSIWVKIGDFGVSKRISIDDATALRTCIYTPSYAAPEVVRQDGKEYSRAVDTWSLGCVIHEVLTRKVPFPDVFELTQYVLGLIPFPSHLDECGVTAPGICFIRKLLAVNPDDRPSAERATQDPWLCATEAIQGMSLLF